MDILPLLLLACGSILIDEFTTFFGLNYYFKKTNNLEEALKLETNPGIRQLYREKGLTNIQIHPWRILIVILAFFIWDIIGLPTMALFCVFVGTGLNNIIYSTHSKTEHPTTTIFKILVLNIIISLLLYFFVSQEPYVFATAIIPFLLSIWNLIFPHLSKPSSSPTS